MSLFHAKELPMLIGREKAQIIRGGAKSSPVEINSYLMHSADVIKAAIIGRRSVALLRNRAADLQGAQADRHQPIAAVVSSNVRPLVDRSTGDTRS